MEPLKALQDSPEMMGATNSGVKDGTGQCTVCTSTGPVPPERPLIFPEAN